MITQCWGHSWNGDRCQSPPRFRVDVGATRTFYACGLHIAWVLRTALADDQTALLRKIGGPA